jgi:DNA polymerase-3 subunit delta'
VPRFEGLVDQKRPLRILSGILAKGNIPHAFLFTGIDGIGKRTAAVLFAMVQNCQVLQPFTIATDRDAGAGCHDMMTPCGQCNSCVKIMAGSHPDVMIVEPEGDVIKIAQVRELSQRLTFKPHDAKARVVVISDAQAMNVEASNALLKALEEPPPQTYFFLTAGQTADLLPTVVSRCQHVRFNPVSTEKIEDCLVHNCGLDPSSAGLAAIISEGSMAEALALAERPERLRDMVLRRKWLVMEMIRLPSSPLPAILTFAQKLAADRKNLLPSLEMIRRFLRDAAVSLCCPERITSTDLREAIADLARHNSPAALFFKMDAVTDAAQAIRQHGNQRLMLEAMALRLADKTA